MEISNIDFQNGFLCGLTAMGIPIDGGGELPVDPPPGGGELPDLDTLTFVNCDYYRGDFEHGVNYLNMDYYVTIFSSKHYYVPDNGGIVMMGAYQLMDWDSWDEDPMALLKITVDGVVIYEGDVWDYFETYDILKRAKVFRYKNSFDISAIRLNGSDSMSLEIFQTMIIGYV